MIRSGVAPHGRGESDIDGRSQFRSRGGLVSVLSGPELAGAQRKFTIFPNPASPASSSCRFVVSEGQKYETAKFLAQPLAGSPSCLTSTEYSHCDFAAQLSTRSPVALPTGAPQLPP